jgi:hypothetical protein
MCENYADLSVWRATILFGSEGVVATSTMRLIACAGLLTTGLLIGGVVVGIAVADNGDSAGPSPDAASMTSKPGSGSGGSKGANGATNPGPPTSTIGNGRQDVDIKSTNVQKKTNDNPIGPTKFHGSLTIPVLRVPKRDELPASGWFDPTLFYTTVAIPVPTLGDVFAALQPKPEPTPAPSPAIRTQVDAPAPVADSGGGGGVEPPSPGVAAEPPVLQAPMVIAPMPDVAAVAAPIPLPPVVAPVAPLGMSAGAGPKQAVAVDVAAAGARAPLIRGSLPPTAVEPQAKALTPMSGQAGRLGYPRYLRDPAVTELAAVALPGAAGLLFLTFSGGFIGYRQANSARFIRTQGAERFLR